MGPEIWSWIRTLYPARRECWWTVLVWGVADNGSRCDDGGTCFASEETPDAP